LGQNYQAETKGYDALVRIYRTTSPDDTNSKENERASQWGGFMSLPKELKKLSDVREVMDGGRH